MSALRDAFKEFARYPSAIMGLVIITALIVLSIYTVITIPYGEGMRLWRGGEDIWIDNPRNARPSWVNFFSTERLPSTIIVSTPPEAGSGGQVLPGGLRPVEMVLTFDYPYGGFPSEINLFLKAKFRERRPFISLFWVTPDGQRIPLGERSVR
ncbi:MAG: ABC transporter permease, partial [Candidatus Binatia bacterium]